jgi:hypothetical protein
MNLKEFRALKESYLDEGEKSLPYGRMMKKSNELADRGEGSRAAKIYLAANAPKGPKVKVRSEDVMTHNIHEISADRALAASKEAGRQAGVYAGLSGGDPKVKAKAVKKREQSERLYKLQAKKRRVKVTQEDLDIYDIILSHLLDEGYADTQEAAEVIMVNMSEEWRESIVDEMLDEELTGERKKRAIQKGFKHLATAREGSATAKNRDSNLPLRRSGYGTKGGGRYGNPMGSLPGVAKAKMYPDRNRPDSDRGSGNKAKRRAGLKVKDNEDRYYYNDTDPDF